MSKQIQGASPADRAVQFTRAPNLANQMGRAFAGGADPIKDEQTGRLAGIRLDTKKHGDGALGAAQAQQWASAMSCQLTQVPVIEYVTQTIALPLTDTQFAASYGSEINLLNQQGLPTGAAAIDSSFAVNGILQTNMFCCGIGVHVFAEPLSFSQIANLVSSTLTGQPISPDVWTKNDLADGALGSLTAVTGMYPAVVEWGFADWNAAYHMANAYQFQWVACQRYLIISELLADVAFYGPYADGKGFGTSDVVAQQYFAQINSYYVGQTAQAFLPISHRRVGSVNSNAVTTAGPIFTSNTGIFHATRDFDLAPVSFGGIGVQAQSGNQPFRKMSKPVYLKQGIPVNMRLQSQDAYHQAQFNRYMSISEGAGGNGIAKVSTTTLAALSGVQNPGTTNAGLEITLDQGANELVQQLVNTDRYLGKGGVLKIACLIKGFEVGGSWEGGFNPNNSALASQVYIPQKNGDVPMLLGG